MPGRPHGEKSNVALAVTEAFDCVQAGTGGTQGGVKRGGDRDGVLVEVSAAADAVVLDALDVRGVVDDLELLRVLPYGVRTK